jgi:two-component system, LytTR family, sensor kinase
MDASLSIPSKRNSLSNLLKPLWNWSLKYKLYHIPFWCAYHYLFWMIAVGNPIQVASTILYTVYSIKFIFYVVFQAIAAYFNLYYLIPHYLEKSRFAEYILYLSVTIFCAACFIVLGYYTIALISEKTYFELFGVDPKKFFHFFINGTFASTIASTTLAMSIKLTKNWIQAKRREQLLEKEKLETELKFLKSQFNPHFLFNTINSIFVLIHKNPSMASDSLAKFSDLLRYQLYECNEHEIRISQELSYLENFIDLQKLRQESEYIDLEINVEEPDLPDLSIPPFILMPFIENAFKHVSKDKSQKNWIRIDLKFHYRQLIFSISNNINPSSSSSREILTYKGIGLKNVQRRLELIYPNDHQLNILQEKEIFRIILKINLHDYSGNTVSTQSMKSAELL